MFLVSSLSKLLQSYNLDEEYQDDTAVDDSDIPKQQLGEQLHPPEKEMDNQIPLPTTGENCSESSEPPDISQELDNFFAVRYLMINEIQIFRYEFMCIS